MKKRKMIFIALLFIISQSAFSQTEDSMRTRNDRPGTPSSLRTPLNAPQNRVHTINHATIPNQSINHGGIEGGSDNHRNATMNHGNNTNGIIVRPQAYKTSPILADSIKSNGTLSKKPSNVTNPIRK